MRTLSSTLPLTFALMTTVPAAFAQGAAADALFDSARTAMATGDYESACQQFRASDKLDPAVGTELNLADCEEKRGHLASAWELYRAVSEKLAESDERIGLTRERIRALTPRVPKLTLLLAPNAPKESSVRDADVDLGSTAFGVALPLDPGTHEFVVSARGFEARTFRITLAEGDSQRLTVEPGARVKSARLDSSSKMARQSSAPATSAQSSGAVRRTAGFVIGGVGIAGLGVGAIAGALMLEKKHTVNDDCHPDKSCNGAGLDAAHSAHTLQVVSNVGWIAGAVALGTGFVLVLTSGSQEKSATTLASTTTLAPVTTLALAPDGSGARFSVSRSF